MKILDKFLMTMFVFIILILSTAIIVLSFGMINMSDIIAIVKNIYGNWLYSMIGAILILASVKLLFGGFDKSSKFINSSISLDSKYGSINISYDAIVSLAERQVRKIDGVKNINIYASKNEDRLNIIMDVTVSPELIIPEIIQLLQKEIKEYIEKATSIYVESVGINVINLNSAVKLKVE